MNAGDIVSVDFGTPIGSEPGFTRPAMVVTADLVLSGSPRTVHVVPITSNTTRRLPTEVEISGTSLALPSVAQAHLCTVVSVERLVGRTESNVGAVQLAQVRSVLADLLDLP
ncbi:MAG TPA: type II toxin-antitoxin system PemK/MazF family toxin [Ilumatobacteraceae bacterium]|nr:type II toxin-antitoxin system PemK/MazF family toxin [Ilumatobacteraceae bacterium]HRB04011.1 type II toxin-antitoxin system PemK/MazF family toxin [Ilumatobacteraceae bacterium]